MMSLRFLLSSSTIRGSLTLVGCLAMSACGGSSGAVGDTTEMLEGSRDQGEVREQCMTEDAEVQTQDINGDGIDDVRRVRVAGVLRCEEFDFDSDGTPELTRFFAEDGQTPIREEHEFDVDGRMDQIVYFENGEVVRKELDTNFNNRVDTWIWCEGGRVSLAERDRRNDGDVDTWERYDAGLITQAAYDDNGDGTPEKWEVFRNGVLIEIRHDTDRDGEPDRMEEIPPDTAGIPEERMSCVVMDSYPDEEREPDPGNGTVQDGTQTTDGEGSEEPYEPTGDPITDGVAEQERTSENSGNTTTEPASEENQ